MNEMTSQTSNWTKRDTFNARMSVGLQDVEPDKHLHIDAAAIGESTDIESGELKSVGYIRSGDITYGTISATAIELIKQIIDMFEDGEDITVTVKKRKSKQGNRDYIVLTLV